MKYKKMKGKNMAKVSKDMLEGCDNLEAALKKAKKKKMYKK